MIKYLYEDIPEIYKSDCYCFDEEIWKDIPGYKGLYQASSLGRIRSVDGKTTYAKRHGERVWRGRIMRFKKRSTYKYGLRVSLWKNGHSKDHAIHRLVASSFLGKSSLTVNHIDGNRLNNNIKNLEWLSIADNIRHGFENGLYPTKQVALMLNGKLKKFISLSQASKHLGKNSGYLSGAIKRGDTIWSQSGQEVQCVWVGSSLSKRRL